jgi:hypothetical protein
MESESAGLRLIEQIERAFKDTVYPGDDRIVENPNDMESSRLRARFKGKHWTTVPLSTLIKDRSGLPLMTPEAFRFFLPAYMHASVVYPDAVDVIPENVVFHLTPPAERSANAEWFRERIRGFSPEQMETIRSFIRYWLASLEPDALIDSDERVRHFWLEGGSR